MTLHTLAPLLAGVIHGDRIVTPVGTVYAGFNGKVKLDRPGHVVVTLGGCSDDVDDLVAAYLAAVAVAS